MGLLLSGPLVEHLGFAVTGTLYSLFGIAATLLIASRWREHLWSPLAAANLRWSPVLVDKMAVQDIRLGAPAATLGDPAVLAQAPGGFSVGTARLGAHLTLDVPTTTRPGTYHATLTYTLI